MPKDMPVFAKKQIPLCHVYMDNKCACMCHTFVTSINHVTRNTLYTLWTTCHVSGLYHWITIATTLQYSLYYTHLFWFIYQTMVQICTITHLITTSILHYWQACSRYKYALYAKLWRAFMEDASEYMCQTCHWHQTCV